MLSKAGACVDRLIAWNLPGQAVQPSTHITERLRRRDFGHIDLQLVIDDSTAYSKPWGASLHLDYVPDEELIESICENEKDFPHMVGK